MYTRTGEIKIKRRDGKSMVGNPAVDIGWKEPVSPERELKIYF